jgi:hypothetical protein
MGSVKEIPIEMICSNTNAGLLVPNLRESQRVVRVIFGVIFAVGNNRQKTRFLQFKNRVYLSLS